MHTILPLSNENEIKFETYRFYLECFVDYINDQYSTYEYLVKHISSSTNRLQGFKDYDKKWVERFLKIAWNTEYISNLDKDEDVELIKITNQWKLIQIYYTIYSLAEATCYLLDGEKADGHKKCQKKLNDYLTKNRISPWNLAYIGPRGKDSKQHKPHNFPIGLDIPNSNLSRANISNVGMIAVCLRAEHKKRIDDGFQRGSSIYKYQYDPGPTTLINFLYRLRIKSNYKDVDIFLTQSDDKDILQFSNNLTEICFYTNTLLEIIIIKKIGKKHFSSYVKTFNENYKKTSCVSNRLVFYNEIL